MAAANERKPVIIQGHRRAAAHAKRRLVLNAAQRTFSHSISYAQTVRSHLGGSLATRDYKF